MIGFYRQEETLVCDGVSLGSIAAAERTPLYVYSAALIRDRYRMFDQAFGGYPHAIHYALKANSTLAIVRVLRGLGCRVDANSGGEIDVALRAGFIPPEIVFTGVGKTRAELENAISLGVTAINAESAGELERIGAIARAQGVRARAALRINPDIDAMSHPHISTGRRINKFGVSIEDAAPIVRDMARRGGVDIVGVHVHVGSQITSLDPLRRAAAAAAALGVQLRSEGFGLEYLDLGGGLGVSYDGARVPTPSEYVQAILEPVRTSGLPIVIEPGRAIVAPAGALVATVVDVKPQSGGKWFVVLDAGMTELLRPALYGAFHRIEPAISANGDLVCCDIVGPVCESSDTLGTNRTMPLPQVGDVLAVLDAGAYGAAMASNYNRRPIPAEALVDEGQARPIRRRQTIDEMLAWEE